MNNIKIFEDFSDEDLEGLLGDIKDLGFRTPPIEGENYGFGPDMKGKNDGKTPLYISDDLINWMVDKGILMKEYVMEFSPEVQNEYRDLSMGDRFNQWINTREIRFYKNVILPGFNRPKVGDVVFYVVSMRSPNTGRRFPSKKGFISQDSVKWCYDFVYSKIKETK